MLALMHTLVLAGAALADTALADTATTCHAPAVCPKSATELATLGQQLNTQGQYLQAAEHLERALMLDPGLKDAQLSYAIALTGMGDLLSANALLLDLLADPQLPATLRLLIAAQQSKLQALRTSATQPADSPAWQHRFSLSARLGFDSNLLGAPNLGSLTLTLPGQAVVLPLDESNLAQSGGYLRTDALLTARRTLPDNAHLEFAANLRSRYSPSVQLSGSTQLDLLLERSQAGPAGHYLNASAGLLQSQNGTRYQTWGAAAGWARTAACHTRAGAELQKRNYLDNPVLSGRYIGMATFVSCETTGGTQWLLGLKAGHDAPDNPARPGASQQLHSLRLASYKPLTAWPAGLLLDIEINHQQDTSGYSALIESGRNRSLVRRTARLQYQHNTSNTTQWVIGTEWVNQTSSLPLFGLRSWGSYTALQLAW